MDSASSPPDASSCWLGRWSSLDPGQELWLLAAVGRTVAALPRLHPWRLGDEQGTGRVITWTAAMDLPSGAPSRPVLAVLARTGRDPHLPLDDGDPTRLLDLAPIEPAAQWAGVLVRLPGTWLPDIALLPTVGAQLDDPWTAWASESVAFDAARRVHAADVRVASDLLAPHVMAGVLDLPRECAVGVAGDAVHVWWRYGTAADAVPGRVQEIGRTTARFAEDFPPFVLADHPDRSGEVQRELDDRATRAQEYRAERRPGRSKDPVLQRIYDAARQDAGL